MIQESTDWNPAHDEVDEQAHEVHEYADARSVIEGIRLILKQGDDEAKHLWNMLTALRGPDHNDLRGWQSVKKHTTNRVRTAVFGNMSSVVTTKIRASFHGSPVDVEELRDLPASKQEVLDKSEHEHFRKHFERAVEAIEALDLDGQ